MILLNVEEGEGEVALAGFALTLPAGSPQMLQGCRHCKVLDDQVQAQIQEEEECH
jgi:hypothetical protein